jgi:hypothetical protein
MKPEDKQAKLVDQADQVVALSCVRELVDQDGCELTIIQHSLRIDAFADAFRKSPGRSEASLR